MLDVGLLSHRSAWGTVLFWEKRKEVGLAASLPACKFRYTCLDLLLVILVMKFQVSQCL